MTHHTRTRAISIILLACLWVGVAQAQRFEVRTFLAPSTGALTTDPTYQYLQSCVKGRYVCPYCSFSCNTPPASGNCPNPWSIAGHPANQPLVDMGTRLTDRLLSLAQPAMTAGHYDLQMPDSTGALTRRAVLGRPFAPTDSGNARRSGLYAQVAGIVNAAPATGPVISSSMHARFLVVPPTPARREAQSTDDPLSAYNFAGRRIMGQVEQDSGHGGNALWAPHSLANSGAGSAAILETNMPSYLTVGVNPYRVDDGDYWFVRYTEVATGAAPVTITQARVELYSVTYGWQGALDASNSPIALTIRNGGGQIPIGFSVLANSGAVKLTFNATNDDGTGWSTAAGTNVWTCGFMVRSNCRLIPGVRDMRDDTTDPRFPLIDASGTYGGKAVFNFLTDPFPGPKKCWFAINNATPNFTTESNIEETGVPPAAYVLPSNATGLGTLAVEWTADAAHTTGVADSWTPNPLGGVANAVYRLSGDEWQYDASFNPTRDLTNTEVANRTPNYGVGLGSHVNLLAGHFMSSRVNVPATGQQWTPDPSLAATNVEPATVDPNCPPYPREVVGWLNGGVITGNYGPGSVTPARAIATTNRWDGTDEIDVCETCGAFWPKASAPARCPYHQPPTVVAKWDVTNIVDAVNGYASYNGRYSQVGTLNGKPYYRNPSGRYLFWVANLPAATPRNRWVMCDVTNPAAWNQVQYRGAAAQANLPANAWTRRGANPPPRPPGNPYLPVVAAATGASALSTLTPLGGGAYAATRDSWRDAIAFTPDERVAGGPMTKQMLPDSALRNASPTVGYGANWGSPTSDQFAVAIPRYQAPSVPGNGVINDQVNDLGYRGGQLYYQNLTAPNSSSGLTNRWDAFYRNPDNGDFQPVAGYWPFTCPGGETRYLYQAASSHYLGSDGHDYGTNAAALMCPVHAQLLSEVAGRHYFCPVCGAEYAEIPAGNACPFDGATIAAPANLIPLGEAVREEHLMAEEYDPFDFQVSVSRQGAVAQATPAVEIGRTAPGVRVQRPDVTVQPLVNHTAFPADVSALPHNAYDASDTRITLSNEGNIWLAPRVGNAYDFVNGTVADKGLDHYLRLGLDSNNMSYGRKAESGPLTRDTLMPFDQTLSGAAAWNVYAQASGSAAGTPTYGFLSAGAYGGRATPKPVPLGQPAGTYLGSNLQYIDSNGNGAFDFFSLSGGAATTTATTQFNPAVDLPLEPLVGVLQGQTRVFETRLPQNDYYSMDSDPIVLPSPTPGVMQVIWATNRAIPKVGDPAPAGVTGDNLPNSNAAVNLVYITTAGVTGGTDDELYRLYNWPVAGGGALTEATAMTADPAGTNNGLPWVMYNQDGSQKWAFWHQSVRHAGGVQATLRYNSTGNWVWPAPGVNNFIYDTGLAKQGLRGFYPLASDGVGTGAWLFWHSGPAGREQLMYRWNFTGAVNANEAPVPVTNQAAAGQMQVPNTAVQGQTDLTYARDYLGAMMAAPIQKPSVSPFTYTKDTSVFSYNGEVNLFFSGFVTHEGNADICWTKYRLASLGPASAADNYGKIPFAPITNLEEMKASGSHQRFASRHLDWMVDRDFATTGPGTTINPSFVLQFAFHDTIGDGLPRGQLSFSVDWTNGTYDRASGIYRVTPVLYGIGGASFPAASPFVIANGAGWNIRAPGPGAAHPLTMDINIAAGTAEFSSPLFNEDAPTDPSAAFTSAFTNAGAALDDVILRINYTPYVYRVTRDQAQDDAPSAFYDATAAQRMTVFWRRSFPTTDAPHFGRAAFMYKVYTTSVQVGRPPVSGSPTFTNHYTGSVVAPNASLPNAGIYNFNVSDVSQQPYLDVSYKDANNNTHDERHQLIGWSKEMTVPVDTVMGEGSPVAVPEAFGVPMNEGSATTIPTVRYWLFWSSPRGVYDLRLVENNATTPRIAPLASGAYDLPVHPSADIYTAVVAPEFGSLTPERQLHTVTTDGT